MRRAVASARVRSPNRVAAGARTAARRALAAVCLAAGLVDAPFPHALAAGAQDERTSRRWTPDAVSTAGYESTPAFTPDGREMYYVAADAAFRGWRIVVSTCRDGRWSAPRPAPFAAPPPVIEADPFVTRDGRRLYYVSSRHAPEREDFDIWFVERRANGTWSEPQRLPEPVNSAGAELLPNVDDAGRLYFGSSREGGHGGSDIYVAERTADGWHVRNLGPPVSTAADEYEAAVTRDGRRLVLVANRGERSHLYGFERRGDRWVETGRLPGFDHVFQVGPVLSPGGERLAYAQQDGARSGEIYVADLVPDASEAWPPACGPEAPLTRD